MKKRGGKNKMAYLKIDFKMIINIIEGKNKTVKII